MPLRPDDAAKPRRGYAGRSAEQLRDERRERLNEAALALFAERGYAKTPIELICARARVTTRHFYEEYEGREALLAHLYRQIVDSARNAVLTAIRQTGLTVEQRIHSAIHAFIRSYTDDPRCARLACVEVIGVSDSITQMRRRMIHEFAETIEAFSRQLAIEGTLASRDFHLGAICLIGGTNELMTEWLASTTPPSVPQLTEQLLRFCSALFIGARILDQKAPAADFSTGR